MTRSVDIPQEGWSSFVAMLNRVANGRPVRLEVAQRELGDEEMGNLLPLLEVDFERKGSERGALVIAVGGDGGELTHVIDEPMGLAVGLNEANELQWVAVNERGEATTIIHFEQLPELEREYRETP